MAAAITRSRLGVADGRFGVEEEVPAPERRQRQPNENTKTQNTTNSTHAPANARLAAEHLLDAGERDECVVAEKPLCRRSQPAPQARTTMRRAPRHGSAHSTCSVRPRACPSGRRRRTARRHRSCAPNKRAQQCQKEAKESAEGSLTRPTNRHPAAASACTAACPTRSEIARSDQPWPFARHSRSAGRERL